MASSVIGLFESGSSADRVIEDLLAAGFNERNINHYEGDQEGVEDELEREGITDADARYYTDGLKQGGSLVSVRANDHQVDEAVEIMNRYAGGDPESNTEYAAGSTAGTPVLDSSLDAATIGMTDATATGTDEARLEVAEERLTVGKRAVQRGGMRVRRVVTERPVEAQVTLREETIRLERRPLDRAVSGADGDPFSEQSFEFTETDEEAVVGKETRVLEEVVVGKTVEQRTETVRDTVRRTDVEIEQLAATGDVTADATTVYGQALASDARYTGRSWDELEADARTAWERDHRGSSWEQARGSVRSSWERARGGR